MTLLGLGVVQLRVNWLIEILPPILHSHPPPDCFTPPHFNIYDRSQKPHSSRTETPSRSKTNKTPLKNINNKMSSNFSGHFGSASTNLDQPFSNYSNGSAAFHQGGNNQLQSAQGHDNGATQSRPQPQHQISSSNAQTTMGGSHKAETNADNTTTPSALQGSTQTMFHPNHLGGIPAGWRTEGFWNLRAVFTSPSGQLIETTIANLYLHFPSAHEEIWEHHRQWRQKQAGQAQPEELRHLNVNPVVARVKEEGKPAKSMTKQSKATKPASTPRNKTTTAAAAPTTNQVPLYTPDADLDTPQKCRDYLAYVDPADVLTLTIPDDDWQDVLQNRKHEFIAQIFAALPHPYAQDPPAGIILDEDARTKYYTQQDANTTKVYSVLRTTSQIKAAKALCSILFDAAVYVHEGGVPKEMYDMNQWYVRKERQVDRKYRLDLESICSARLDKIVEGIKVNKLIAVDVLEQKNYHRMARDPEFYLLEKFTYLRSNKTRQEKIDVHNKQLEQDE